MRIGVGMDAHAFDAGRPLVLGGITIPGSAGLGGHSDADVLSHAIADAMLGAAALGDLGDHFPATERWKDAPSLDMLREANRRISEAGWIVANVDATVIAQTPALAPHRGAIVSSLAATLDLERSAVSVKATTTDRMGFTGRGEGIAALAVVLLERPPH